MLLVDLVATAVSATLRLPAAAGNAFGQNSQLLRKQSSSSMQLATSAAMIRTR